MNKENFIEELKKINIFIDEDQLIKLEKYYELIIEYNSHTNLTRITDKNEVYLKHYYDSLTLVKAIKLSNQKILDVGTGAGFPGLVLKIVFPNLKVTLIDSLSKRITFLNEVIEKLGLKDIEAVHTRAEDFIKNNREKYDIVTSRAVANLRVLSELCIPFVKIHGYFIPMKADANDELKDSITSIETLGAVIEKSIDFYLYNNDLIRKLIKIKKINKTSIKYPRKFSEIKKKPL